MSRKSILKLLLIFLLSALLSFGLQRFFHISLTEIQAYVTSTGIWAPIAYVWILFLGLSVPFNPISDSITVSIAALVFPPWIAILTTFIAHTTALAVNYLLAREFGVRVLKKLLSESEVKKIEDLKSKLHPAWVFGLRFLLPLNGLGFDFISYASGIARMNFRSFYLASIVPWTLLSLIFFSSAGWLRDINPALILLPFVFVVAIPILILVLTKKDSLLDRFKALFDK